MRKRKRKGTARRTAGRTASGKLKKGYRLTAGGRVVKATRKRGKRRR